MSTAQSNDQNDKSNKSDNKAIDKTEIKFIDNKSDKKISSEIDALNESLYKLNNYLRLTKDIDGLKKEKLVKDDIQRKFHLKQQWLNSNHGSTASLNSMEKGSCSSIDTNPDRADENKDSGLGSEHRPRRKLSRSTQNLSTRNSTPERSGAKGKRKHFGGSRASSVQNINASANGKPRRRHRSNYTSFDELNFMENLSLSAQDIEKLGSDPDFQQPKAETTNEGKKKMAELKKFIDKRKSKESQVVAPKVMRDPSRHDLSRFFPRKDEKENSPSASKPAKDSKLKDVDLSKYFLPSPVQELKSLPSPSQSPQMARKQIEMKPPVHQSAQRVAITTLQKPQAAEAKIELKQNEPVRLRKHNLESLSVDKKLDVDEALLSSGRSPSGDYSRFFDSIKSPVDNIDELFEEMAAKVIPQEQNKESAKKSVKQSPKHSPKQSPKQTPKDSPKQSLKDDHNERILSSLSTNLQNEIKKLEEQLTLNEPPNIRDAKTDNQIEISLPTGAAMTVESGVTSKPPRSRRNSAQLSKIPSTESSTPPEEPIKRKKSVVDLAEQFNEIVTAQTKPPPAKENGKNNAEEEILLAKGMIDEFGNEVPKSRSRKNSVVELAQKFDAPLTSESAASNATENEKAKNEWKVNEAYKPILTPEVSEVKKTETLNDKSKEANRKSAAEKSPIEPKPQSSSEKSRLKMKKTNEENLKIEPKKSVADKPQVEAKKENTQKINDEKKQTDSNESATNLCSQTEELSNESTAPKSMPIKPARRKLSASTPSSPVMTASKPTNERELSPPMSPIRTRRTKQFSPPSSPKPDSFAAKSAVLPDSPKVEHKPPTPRSSDFSGFNIPPEELQRRHEFLTKAVSPPKDDIPPLRRISDILGSNDRCESPSTSRATERNPNYVYAKPGVYDNIPSTQQQNEPAVTFEYDRDYDNVPEREPVKPERKKSPKSRDNEHTDLLIARSQMIHNKKQEFMNEKIVGNNPYLKRMLERESRESLRSEDVPSEKVEARRFDRSDFSEDRQQTFVETKKKSGSLRSLNACISSSTGHSVLDVFKRSPTTEKSASNKDNCVIC